MADIAAEPLVRLLLTAVLCLVPTAAFLGLLRLLDRLRNDVLVEHTMRMAAEEGATSGVAGTRFDPGAALASGRRPGSDRPSREWGDPDTRRRLVLCDACATLRSSRPGACPSCGAVLEDPRDRRPPG
ncbi:hypothetical protein [Halobaculum lipolyticum]|uniref:Zinc ribbon domain-containing protein n=1 Tax=Halobaculum lipolyticum TaxID=3032001 RepID=A0ABD5W9P3_9EURY|nr:hypothetical protein [Halobaculum sp. DT31]